MAVIRFYGIHCNFTCVRCENVFVICFLCEVASIDSNELWSPNVLVSDGTNRDLGSRQLLTFPSKAKKKEFYLR